MDSAPIAASAVVAAVASASAVPLTDSTSKSHPSTTLDLGGQIITPAPLTVVSPTHSGTQSPILTSTIDPITTIAVNTTINNNDNSTTTITNNSNLSSSANPTNPISSSSSSDHRPSSSEAINEYVERDRVEVLYEANGEYYPAVVTLRIDAAYTGNQSTTMHPLRTTMLSRPHTFHSIPSLLI